MPKKQERQRADAGVRAMPAGEGSVAGELLGDHHDGGEVEFHAAVFFGNDDGGEAELGGFAQSGHGDAGLVVLNRFEVGLDFLVEEFARRCGRWRGALR